MDRTIFHCDVDHCYAQIELREHPEWRNRPLAVGGSREDRHGIILAKCPQAKRAGVKTGMALWQATQLCPNIRLVRPRSSLYVETTDRIREIYSDYTDLVEDFGIDESWLDVTGTTRDGEATARELQARIKAEIGLTVSIGVSWNKTMAKLGSDMFKPNGISVITRENFQDVVWPLPAEDLLMVGRATKTKLNRMGIKTIGDIAQADPTLLKGRFGVHGLTLSAYANGLENSPVRVEHSVRAEKSIGNSWTTPKDLETDSDIWITLNGLCEGVGMRLRKGGYLAGVVEFAYRTTDLHWASHQRKLDVPTDITQELHNICYELYKEKGITPLRSIGVRASALVPNTLPQQLDIFGNSLRREKLRAIDSTLDALRSHYGYDAVQRGTKYADKDLGKLNALKHTVHPVGWRA